MGQAAGCDSLPCCTKNTSTSQEVVRARPVAYDTADGQLAKGEVPGSLPQARRVDRCNISGNGMSDAFESA
ncbi:ADP-ribosylation factor [Durusdinium trenchii]|uniref:ADP-ribosylation factor n=1 Tax=Durusdinium trenchii TaxID=1381693 RepID=A0ABP0JB89_9DINO